MVAVAAVTATLILVRALGVDLGFAVVRLFVNLVAAGGMVIVARELYIGWDETPAPSLYSIAMFLGVAFYNVVAGTWFAVLEAGLLSPPVFWLKHVYTIANGFETLPAIVFARYLLKQQD